MEVLFVIDKTFQSHMESRIVEQGELQFLIEILSKKEIDHFWKKGWFPEAAWLLHRVDALCLKQQVGCAKEYDFIRNTRVFGRTGE